MEEYPEELRTPPVGLIALVGCPELHQMISTHLHSEQPPINTLALPDYSKISVMARKHKETGDGNAPPEGIIKRDWLIKHRNRIPAVVAALFRSDHISGDPGQWLQLCTHLDELKAVIRDRNIKLILAVVQSSSRDDIVEDRMIALRKRADIDQKYIISLALDEERERKPSLNRLASLFSELLSTYYRDEGRRVKTRVEKKSFSSIELAIRYCFKVAVYAEFQRDWVEALKFYEEAYHALREMVGTSTRLQPIQRLVEIKLVAEQLHFKISTLLLHGGKIIEAVLWFHQHCANYKKLLGAPHITFLHLEWMSKQFLVFAELLETSSRKFPGFQSLLSTSMEKGLTEWEFQPAYYYQLAAQYMMEKRSYFDHALSLLDTTENDTTSESVVPSSYVGQYARLLEQSDDAITMQPLTDEEFTRYCIAEGKQFQDSIEIIALLRKSFDMYSSLKAVRMASYCGFQMAKEYLSVGDLKKAKQFFDSAISFYRHEGWISLLWEILGYLRECSRQDGFLKEFVEHSLEMAALPISSDSSSMQTCSIKDCGPAGPPTIERRQIILKDLLHRISPGPGVVSNKDGRDLRVTENHPLHLEIDPVSPLRVALLACVAFHEQAVKPGKPALFSLSLLSELPLDVEIDALEVEFNQSDCNFTILNSRKSKSAKNLCISQNGRLENADALNLVTNKWLRLVYDVKSEQSGKLECVSVIARIGSHFTICCRAESPASMSDLPLWKFEERLESLPTKDPALAFLGQKYTQVEEPEPEVDMSIGSSGPALVGESFIVPVTITSKGHSVYAGELKINLVDTRGGGLVSPKEIETQSSDGRHVELVEVFSDTEDKNKAGSESIRKVQHSFGLISVPYMKNGESWSCKLEIKWHRPKPVMLFVSLSYSPHGKDSTLQKAHVHRSLEIEGKTPVAVSHCIMLPFRRDPLVVSSVRPTFDSDGLPVLPGNETSILVVSVKNSTEVPLRLLSISTEKDAEEAESSCLICQANDDHANSAGPALLVPGKECKKVFSVKPIGKASKVKMGTLCIRWQRDSSTFDHNDASSVGVLTEYELPDANLEFSPLIVSLECPPYAILGQPFTYFVKIQNQTTLLQEIKFSLTDSQSFVSTGSQSDTIFVLPKSAHVLTYKVVPLVSGTQHLPRVTLKAVRYAAEFQPSLAASSIWVFPSKPLLEMETKPSEPGAQILGAE